MKTMLILLYLFGAALMSGALHDKHWPAKDCILGGIAWPLIAESRLIIYTVNEIGSPKS